MKHCVDGVARLMLKYFSFFISVAGFKKNSNGYVEKIQHYQPSHSLAQGELKRLRRGSRELTRVNEILQTRISFFVSRCEQARNWNMSLLTCTRLDVVSSLCVVFLKPCLRTVLLLLVFTTCLNLWWLSVMKFQREISQKFQDDKSMRVYGYRTVCAQLINQEWLHIGLRPGHCSYVLVRNTRNTSQ